MYLPVTNFCLFKGSEEVSLAHRLYLGQPCVCFAFKLAIMHNIQVHNFKNEKSIIEVNFLRYVLCKLTFYFTLLYMMLFTMLFKE